jgi:hypothetical protein
MTAPTNKKQLRRFLGMVNFYQDMWRQRSHILAPLTKLTSNKAVRLKTILLGASIIFVNGTIN